MGWLLELLFGAIREMCSQFIVDMMDIASGMFTEILSCDLDLFEELFGVAGDLYHNAVLPIAIALLLMILVWQLFKSMFGKMGTVSEDPIELVFRSCLCLFMIVFAKDIVNYIMEIAGTPYQWITGTEIDVESFSEYVSVSEAATSALGVDAISIQLLLLVMQFVVAWNYFKMLFLLAERYVLLGIFSYTSPLAFATGGSKATNNILGSWTKMFGGQVMIVILDAWCVKMFLSGYGNLMASSYGFTKFFAATMCLIGFCKITGKLDSYMGSLGVNLGRSGGGLSGLGALMMAGRLLHGGGRAAAGTSGNAAAGHMNFGTGKSIPLGRGNPDAAAGGKSSRWPFMSGGIGGMKDEMGDASATKGSDKEDGAAPWTKEGYDAFVPDGQNMDDKNLPFGNPEEAAWDASGSAEDTNSMSADGTQGADGFADMGGFEQPDGLDHLSSEMGDAGQGMPESAGETGYLPDGENIIPCMDMSEGGPFGIPAKGSAEGIQGMEDSESVMESPTEMDGISARSAVTGIYSSMAMDDSDVSPEGTQPKDTYSDPISGAGAGYDTAEIGSISEGGSRDMDAGGGSGLVSDGLTGAEQVSDGYGYTGTGGYGYGEADDYGVLENAGIYAAEHDGEAYMRYDAGLYEKPDGKYQTIHENGKTFYELPEGEKAPAVLPQMKAVLEKNGNIRLEKTNHKEAEKQDRHTQAPVYVGNPSFGHQKQIPGKRNRPGKAGDEEKRPTGKKGRRKNNPGRK